MAARKIGAGAQQMATRRRSRAETEAAIVTVFTQEIVNQYNFDYVLDAAIGSLEDAIDFTGQNVERLLHRNGLGAYDIDELGIDPERLADLVYEAVKRKLPRLLCEVIKYKYAEHCELSSAKSDLIDVVRERI